MVVVSIKPRCDCETRATRTYAMCEASLGVNDECSDMKVFQPFQLCLLSEYKLESFEEI